MVRPSFFSWLLFVLTVVLCLPAGARTLYVAPDGDDATARADDPTQPFQSLTNAFQALENGDRLEISAGKYTITPGFPNAYYGLPDYAPMKLQNLTNVTVFGSGEVEIYGEGPGDFLMIEFCENVRIENLTLKGNHPPVPGDPPQLYSMVLLRAVNDSLHFENCRFIGFGDHAISDLFTAKESFNLVVTNCYFADGGGLEVAYLDVDGAAISGISAGARIVNNVIENCLRGIEVEGAHDGQITNVLIEGNLITNCYGAGIMLFATDHYGLNRPDSYSDIRIINNKISNMYPHPDRDPYITYGIVLFGGEKLLVMSNLVENARFGMGIDASSLQMPMRDVVIASNVVQDVRFRGIQHNQFSSLENGLIIGNTVRRVGDEGILMNGKNIQCRENLVEDSAYADERGSISLGGSSVGGIIADNVIRNSSTNYSDYGIWLRGATNTTLFGNTFSFVPKGAIRDEGINTRVLPKIHSLTNSDSVVELSVSGLPGNNYRIEAGHDFESWTVVTNKTCPENGLFDLWYVADPPQPDNPQTFFRVVLDEAPE